jgi:hypothetical protein
MYLPARPHIHFISGSAERISINKLPVILNVWRMGSAGLIGYARAGHGSRAV